MAIKPRREILGAAAIIVTLLAYSIGSEIYYRRTISPKGILTVNDFLERFGEPRRIRMVTREGRSYYEFTGHLPSPWLAAVPSAPPAYIFDEQGQFSGWCSDPGDAPSYRRTWPLLSTNAVDLTVVRKTLGL
jgi:hypothetical protein